VQRLTSEVVALSLSRSAPPWLRERAPQGAVSRRAVLDALADVASERLVLQTCERVETYFAAEGGGEAFAPVDALARWLRVPPEALAPHLAVHRGHGAARHLFRVTAGLESRLIGELQVRAQVRQAFAEAREARALGPLLDALARAALHTGRLVHRETDLGRSTSLAELTLRRLRDDLGGLRGRSVVVAGTGRLAAEVAAALSGAGAQLAIASRERERARTLSARFAGAALARDDLDRALAEADGLVTCTQGLLPIGSARRPLAVVDLGAPANVPTRLAADPRVRLTRLDELTRGDAGGLEVAKAIRIVEHEATRFQLWRAARAQAAA
jgi:glutamyl-tRNA reductase